MTISGPLPRCAAAVAPDSTLPFWRHPPAIGRTLREVVVAAVIVLSASAIAIADDHLPDIPDWIPDVLDFPADAEIVTDRAIGSSVRMFSILTGADIDELFAEWEQSLSESGYPISNTGRDLLDLSIEFSGQGIVNAKIIVGPAPANERSLIEFDATLN